MELDKMLAAEIIEVVEEILSWCQDVSKVCTMSKTLIGVQPELWIVPKKKGVSELKM